MFQIASSPATLSTRARIAAEVSEARATLASRLEAVASPAQLHQYSGIGAHNKRAWTADAEVFDSDHAEIDRDALLVEVARKDALVVGLEAQLAASRGALVAQKRAAVIWVGNLRKELAANRLTIDAQAAALAAAGAAAPPATPTKSGLRPTPSYAGPPSTPAMVRAAETAFEIKLVAAATEAERVLANVTGRLQSELDGALAAADAAAQQLDATRSELTRARVEVAEANVKCESATSALTRERGVSTERLAAATERWEVAQQLADQVVADKSALESLVKAKDASVAAHTEENTSLSERAHSMQMEVEVARTRAREAERERAVAAQQLSAERAAAARERKGSAKVARSLEGIVAELTTAKDRVAELEARCSVVTSELTESEASSSLLLAAVSAKDEAEKLLRTQIGARDAQCAALQGELDELAMQRSEWANSLDSMESALRTKKDDLASLRVVLEEGQMRFAALSVEAADAQQRAMLATEERDLLATRLAATVSSSASLLGEEQERMASESSKHLAAAQRAEREALAQRDEALQRVVDAEAAVASIQRVAVAERKAATVELRAAVAHVTAGVEEEKRVSQAQISELRSERDRLAVSTAQHVQDVARISLERDRACASEAAAAAEHAPLASPTQETGMAPLVDDAVLGSLSALRTAAYRLSSPPGAMSNPLHAAPVSAATEAESTVVVSAVEAATTTPSLSDAASDSVRAIGSTEVSASTHRTLAPTSTTNPLLGAGASLVPASREVKALWRTDWQCNLNIAAGTALDFVITLPSRKRGLADAAVAAGADADGDTALRAALTPLVPEGLGFALTWTLRVEGGGGVKDGVMVATADDAAAQLIDLSKSNVVAPVTPPGTPAQDSSSDPMLLGSSGVGLSHVGHMRSAACASSATIGRSSIAWSEYTGFDTVRQLALARESKSGKALATTIALDPDVQVVVLRFEHKSGWCVWLAWKCTPSLSLSLSLSSSLHSFAHSHPAFACMSPLQVYDEREKAAS